MPQYPASRKTHTLLPPGYKPSNDDILCGRGKVFSKHPGNQTFTASVRASLQAYVDASKRIDKSVVVSAVANRLREAGNRFVKYDKSRKQWYELSVDSAHEKVGHAIRDLLKTLASQSAPVKAQKVATTEKCKSKRRSPTRRSKKHRSAVPASCKITTMAPVPPDSAPVAAPVSFLESQHLYFSKKIDAEPLGADNILSAVLSISDNMYHGQPLGGAGGFQAVDEMLSMSNVFGSEPMLKPEHSMSQLQLPTNPLDLTSIDDFDIFSSSEETTAADGHLQAFHVAHEDLPHGSELALMIDLFGQA